jgi:hypothetical protein
LTGVRRKPTNGWYWQRGVLEVRLLEGATSRVRGAQRWPIKTSALARDGAVKRALDRADAILKKDLRSTIIVFVTGQGANQWIAEKAREFIFEWWRSRK